MKPLLAQLREPIVELVGELLERDFLRHTRNFIDPPLSELSIKDIPHQAQ